MGASVMYVLKNLKFIPLAYDHRSITSPQDKKYDSGQQKILTFKWDYSSLMSVILLCQHSRFIITSCTCSCRLPTNAHFIFQIILKFNAQCYIFMGLIF